MGRMLILLVLGTSIIFGMTTLNMNNSNTRMLNATVEDYETQQARNLAKSGIDLAVSKIFQDTTWTGVSNLQVAGGKLDVSINSTTSLYPNGEDMGENGREVSAVGTVAGHSVTVKAVLQLPQGSGVPPFFNYALLSEEDLALTGNISIRDANASGINSNIHTNEDLTVRGNASIKGFGSYAGSASFQPNNPSRFFNPNDNPESLPVTAQTSAITIPEFDPSEYVGIATDTYSGTLTLAGNHSLGTKENPKIWYVDGDLHISGNFSGYGVFIVTGNIHLTGNSSVIAADPLGNNLGFYSGGDILMTGNTTIDAQIFSNNNISMRGNIRLNGLATARNTIDLYGNVAVYYKPAAQNLTAPFWSGSEMGKPVVVSYYE